MEIKKKALLHRQYVKQSICLYLMQGKKKTFLEQLFHDMKSNGGAPVNIYIDKVNKVSQ